MGKPHVVKLGVGRHRVVPPDCAMHNRRIDVDGGLIGQPQERQLVRRVGRGASQDSPQDAPQLLPCYLDMVGGTYLAKSRT